LFILLSSQLFAQLENKIQIRATILPIGIDTEFSLSKNISLNFDAGFQPSIFTSISTSNGGETDNSSGFVLAPFIQGSIRSYYNFDTRMRKSKNIEAIENSYNIGAVWGLQRTYNSNIYLDLSLGLGYVNINLENEFIRNSNSFTTIGSFTIGYAFN